MAQQARPHWYAQRLYLRAVLSSEVRGLGSLPLSTSPIRRRCPVSGIPASDPAEDLLLPRVEQPEGEDGDEDAHLGEPEPAIGLGSGGEGEYEDRLDVEQHEQQCE